MKRLLFLLLVLGVVAHAQDKIQSFRLPQMNLSGDSYDMEDHLTGIFVLETYYLNCPYCNDNAPNVNALAQKYAENPRVQVLDVGKDTKDPDYSTWIDRHYPNHPVLKDAQRVLIKQLGTTAYPSTYVVSCTGAIVYKTVGVWSSQTKRDIERAIESLNQEDCPL